MKRGALALLVATAGALALPAGAGAQSSRAVLVIGDSLQEGTGPYLHQELRGLATVTVDAGKGRPSPEGVAALRSRLRPDHSVVVFDLGVNNDLSSPQILEADLRAVRGLVGERCLVVASFARPPLGGATIEAANGVVRRFAAETPGVQLVDWQAATQADPGLLSADGVHASAGGYAVRAQLVADGVRACLTAGSGSAPPGVPPPRSGPRVPSRLAPEAGPRAPADVSGIDLRALGPYPFVLRCIGQAAGLLASAASEVSDVVRPRQAEPVLGAP